VNDEGFREIQLNGKQLVFLFMAVTVVSVLIFLFGVLVGRGARTGRTTEMASGEVAPDPGLSAPVENIAAAPTEAPVPSAEPSGAKAPEELSYAERLLHDAPAQEHLKAPGATPPSREPSSKPAPAAQTSATQKPEAPPPAQTPAAQPPAVQAANTQKPAGQTATPQKPSAQAPVVPEPVAAAARPAPPTPPPSKAVESAAPPATGQPTDPSGPGFAVQVAAYRDRRESDTLAKQLIAKGYPAFVMDPVKGAPTALFRVRVGKYKTLKDAQTVMAQLQTAEQFNTAWIAR
jgi:cell division protein FtsN